MSKDRDSLTYFTNGVQLELDYSYHRYHEPEGSYLDWDIVGLYADGKPISEAEAKKIDPKCFDVFDDIIRWNH
jgi:hypothetical protein